MAQVLKAKFQNLIVTVDYDETSRYPYKIYAHAGTKHKHKVEEVESFQEVLEELPHIFY